MARAYCHCSSCRELYDLPVLSAAAWAHESVRIVKGHEFVGKFKHPDKQMERHFCRSCGTTVFGTNRIDLTIIRTSLLAKAMGEDFQETLKPEFHLFYSQREIAIDDGLPKYLEGWDGPLFSSGAPTES